MKEYIYRLGDVLSLLKPYKDEDTKAASAYWHLKDRIEKLEKLSFAFPSGDNPGLTRREYTAITLKVSRSGDPDIDAMIRESRKDDFAKAALAGISAKVYKTKDYNGSFIWGDIADEARIMADAMIAEMEKEVQG